MILLREIQDRDLDALERFAQIPGFINLPNDRDLLKERIHRASISFRGENEDFSEGKYIFIAEDLATRQILGTSMIASQHGTEESPHFYLQVGSEEKFSKTIQTGFIHGTLTLKTDSNGPSEIGGLVIDPQWRNSDQRVGRQIAFVRFLFLALNREKFKDRILAELLPPINKRGQAPLWEAIGRRFTNMDYWEADQLSQKDKEFILSLFPIEKIYTTFLSAEARNSIGKVGKETEPVLHMLKKIGFEYQKQVDPFDGGPHFMGEVSRLQPILRMARYALSSAPSQSQSPEMIGLLASSAQQPGQFRAIHAAVKVSGSELSLQSPSLPEASEALSLKAGDAVAFMPYY